MKSHYFTVCNKIKITFNVKSLDSFWSVLLLFFYIFVLLTMLAFKEYQQRLWKIDY